MSKKLKGFCDDFIETGHGTKSALNNYEIKGRNKENIASTISSENLRKPNVIEYLQSKAQEAASRIEKLSKTAKNEQVRLYANKDMLDRAGFKPAEKVEVEEVTRVILID